MKAVVLDELQRLRPKLRDRNLTSLERNFVYAAMPALLSVAAAADDLRLYEPGKAGEVAARALLFDALKPLLIQATTEGVAS